MAVGQRGFQFFASRGIPAPPPCKSRA